MYMPEYKKICAYCGKEFTTTSKRQKYCKDIHYDKCPVCGKEVIVKDLEHGPRACSRECSVKLQQQRCLEKYGETSYLRTDEGKARVKATMQEKYGVDYPAHSPIIQAKIKSTLLGRYGVDHPMKSRELVNRLIESNLKRYGVRSTLQCENVKNRIAKTIQEKYGTLYYTKSDDYALSKFNSQWDHLYKQDAADCIRKFVSTIEYEVIEFIKSLKDDINVIHNDRNVISPLEIDVYLPEFRFGIECNPSFTHNASIPDPWGAEPKHYLYHKEKSDKCREAGVELFHIFGWEWEYKQDIIKSMIKNRLGLTDRRIYARNTKIVEVDFKTSVSFLNKNHLQGMLSAPIRLGLIDSNNELVSLMTFGKMRSTIGQGQGNQYELSRFCNKLNTSVVGGASKLLKHYMKEYNTPLISFSDNAHTTGKL